MRDAQRQYNKRLRAMSGVSEELMGPAPVRTGYWEAKLSNEGLVSEYGSQGNVRFITSQPCPEMVKPVDYDYKKPRGYHCTPNETWAILPCKPGRVYHRRDPNPPTELCREDIDNALKGLGYDPEPDMYVQSFLGKLDIQERLKMYGKNVQLGKTATFRRYEPLC